MQSAQLSRKLTFQIHEALNLMNLNFCETKRYKVKPIEKNEKKWGNGGWNCVITVVSHPLLLVSVQPKLCNYRWLFCYFVKQPKLTSLFRLVSILVSVLVSVVSIWTEFRRSFVDNPSADIIFSGLNLSVAHCMLNCIHGRKAKNGFYDDVV
jgi:hypothetical protein